MNKKIYEFDAIIKTMDDTNGAFVEFPYDVKEEFNKGRVKVIATFDSIEYNKALLAKWKTERHITIIPKEIREKLKKDINDTVKVTIIERE